MEDNRADIFLVREALRAYGVGARLQVIEDGEEAMKFIDQIEADDSLPCPGLLLLDLNLPRRSGAEILERLRRGARCATIPVIIVTSSNSPTDRQHATNFGATRYFRKPSNYNAFLKLGEIVSECLKSSGIH